MILDSKLDILSRISALRSLIDFSDTENTFSNFQSVNGNENVLSFLIDLLKSIVGFDKIKSETINFLVVNLTPIETSIKLLMKKLLKKYFFCNTDSIIPENLICKNDNSSGINIPLNSIDFFNLFSIDPESDTGLMLYGNPQLDFNAFLYEVIQDSGNASNWNDIVEISFHESGQKVDGIATNNVFRVCVHENYNGKTVHELMDDFIDSIPLLQIELLISRIFDGIFGTLSSYRNTNCFDTLVAEEEFNVLVDKILDLPDIEIDNSFFEFSNAEKVSIRTNISSRSVGKAYLKDCCLYTQQIDFQDLSDLISDLRIKSTEIEQRTILENSFNVLIEESLSDLSESDNAYNLLEFYEGFFRGILKGILNIVFSPKLMLIFSFYFNVVSGVSGFTNVKDFIRQHSGFFKDIINEILLPLFLKFLFEIIIKEVKILLSRELVEKKKEKARLYRLQLESLTNIGLPNLGVDIF